MPEQDCSGDHRTHYETILTDAQLDAWIARLEAAPAFALDTETTSLNAMQAELVGISFAIRGHGAGAPTCRWRTTMPARPRSSTATPRWRS